MSDEQLLAIVVTIYTAKAVRPRAALIAAIVYALIYAIVRLARGFT